MLAHLHQQLQQHFPHHQHFLLAFSGGVDSMVLLHLLAQLPIQLRAIHIHHGLSPNADHWATFCEQQCKRLEIPFILQKVSVDGENGMEASARTARYQAIQMHKFAEEVVITAHHLDDQAETFFLALKRGCGLKGLGGMQTTSHWQNMPLFRPLLEVSKSEILSYAKQQQLAWVEDESNLSNTYERNFLRNAVLPQLNQRWQHFNQMVGRACQHLTNQQQLLDELLGEQLAMYSDTDSRSLNIADFPAFSVAKQQELMRLWLAQQGQAMPSQKLLTQILNQMLVADTDKHPEIQLDEQWLRRYQQRIFLTPHFAETKDFSAVLEPNTEMALPDNLGVIVRKQSEIICKTSGKFIRLPLPNALEQEPLTAKLHHSGKVKCYGKPHREEMKKIWQTHQIPVWLRTRTPLIFWQDELVGCLPTL